MKRLISLVTLAVLLVTLLVPSFAVAAETRGDANGDGTVNMKDVLLLRKHLAGIAVSGLDEQASDVNDDGAVNMKDVLSLRKYLAGIPVPGMDNGNTPKNAYADLKAFVMKNGEVSGDTVYFIRPSEIYGGMAGGNFNIFYYADSGKISFCLHCPMDADHILNIYVDVPSTGTEYTYLTSYCYLSGESLLNANGIIPTGEFTTNYPLPCSYYYGDNASRPTFLELSRQGVCDLLSCVNNFLQAEGFGYSLSDIGFKKF